MLSKEEVIKIAKLARIALTEKEVEKFQKELSTVLDYVEELKGRQTHPTEGWPYSVMGLHKSMETHIPTGVTLYSIKQILKEAGFELIPIKKEEE